MTPDIASFGRALRSGATTSAAATDACLSRIQSENPRLNAFILVMADEARTQAAEADRELAGGQDRGPLHGVPLSLKDLVDVRGTATTAASRVREGHIASQDATIVTRLRAAGAVILGKTNLHEFAFGTTSEESAFGAVRNPHDTGRSAGGSSGGSAVSVATGMALGTIGTDTGGSVRIPAAACGLVGLKPTYGEIPVDGIVPLSLTFDHVGPLAASVTDAWLLYRGLLGQTETAALVPAQTRALRLGKLRGYFCDLLDDEVRARFDGALARLHGAGARIDDAAVEHAALTAPVYTHVSFGDAAAYHAGALATMADRYTRPVRLRIEAAGYVLAQDYVRGLAGREVLRREVDRALAGRDALVLPTLPIPAPLLGAELAQVGSSKQPVRALMLRLTQLFNVTGHPAISLPCGTTADGLPCGLQLVGARGKTAELLRVARTVEQALSA